MGIIEAAKLVFEYAKYSEEGSVESVVRAIDGVDLDVFPGQFIAILGHNGSGKSTLAKQMNAILTPTEGTLYVDGKDTKKEENIWPIRQTAGMVFQNPDNQIIGTVVEEDVGFGPENMGVPTQEIWERVEKSLKSVGMWEYRKNSPNKLSGGQKQKIAIARALLEPRECLAMDEPTAALDALTEKELVDYILETHMDKTRIMISHRMSTCVRSDGILVLQDGRLAEKGAHEELMKQNGVYAELFGVQKEMYYETEGNKI